MIYNKIFHHGKGIREILVSTVTAISVGIIIYQLVYNPTKLMETWNICIWFNCNCYSNYRFLFENEGVKRK